MTATVRELAANAPMLVFPDVNLEQLAAVATRRESPQRQQVCIAPQRFWWRAGIDGSLTCGHKWQPARGTGASTRTPTRPLITRDGVGVAGTRRIGSTAGATVRVRRGGAPDRPRG